MSDSLAARLSPLALPASQRGEFVTIVGGGASGYFAAIAAAEADPRATVTLFEAAPQPLAKVRISGGGRCNVTHACFEPRELVKRYPRGGRELLGPFHRFGPRETIAWFQERGVALHAEPDGRMFPVTNDSATIVACLEREAERAGVRVNLRCGVRAVQVQEGRFQLELANGSRVEADRLILATGGLKAGAGAPFLDGFLARCGHHVEPPVPSLFTFHLDDPRLAGLEGLAVPLAAVAVPEHKLHVAGPVLVTHWGLSGPAVLQLSAWGARVLAECGYKFTVQVNWVAPRKAPQVAAELAAARSAHAKKQIGGGNPFGLPGRLWERLVSAAGIAPDAVWTSVSNQSLQALTTQLAAGSFAVAGRSLNKEEFVTCGGVRLSEIDFATMRSKLCPGLHVAGELLDLDGITGGFNFQAAWTTGWLAGRNGR